jgi:hypothetical protein
MSNEDIETQHRVLSGGGGGGGVALHGLLPSMSSSSASQQQRLRCCTWGKSIDVLWKIAVLVLLIAAVSLGAKYVEYDASYASQVLAPLNAQLATLGGLGTTVNATCYSNLVFRNAANSVVASGWICLNPATGSVVWNVAIAPVFAAQWATPLAHFAVHGLRTATVTTAPVYLPLDPVSGVYARNVLFGRRLFVPENVANVVTVSSLAQQQQQQQQQPPQQRQYYLEIRTAAMDVADSLFA